MNSKTVAILLTLLCLILAAALIYRHSKATYEKAEDVKTINHFSNNWVEVSGKLEDQKQVNLTLERDVANQGEKLEALSNHLAALNVTYTKAQADAKAAAETASQELRKRDAKITELEGQRDGMTHKMNDLTNSIASLETQITDTQRKLEASEGDREFLLKELKRLQAEKSDLERQFNNLAMLREQVRHLRDELSISRRLEWIRRGLYGSLKGGELLHKSLASATTRTNYNLDVEIRRQGGATVLTNSAAPAPSAVTTNAASSAKE